MTKFKRYNQKKKDFNTFSHPISIMNFIDVNMFMKLKDPIPLMKRANVFHNIPCLGDKTAGTCRDLATKSSNSIRLENHRLDLNRIIKGFWAKRISLTELVTQYEHWNIIKIFWSKFSDPQLLYLLSVNWICLSHVYEYICNVFIFCVWQAMKHKYSETLA